MKLFNLIGQTCEACAIYLYNFIGKKILVQASSPKYYQHISKQKNQGHHQLKTTIYSYSGSCITLWKSSTCKDECRVSARAFTCSKIVQLISWTSASAKAVTKLPATSFCRSATACRPSWIVEFYPRFISLFRQVATSKSFWRRLILASPLPHPSVLFLQTFASLELWTSVLQCCLAGTWAVTCFCDLPCIKSISRLKGNMLVDSCHHFQQPMSF